MNILKILFFFTGKNRHHLALFVRNCKLVLLLRKEYQEGEENTFRPAEWRWKLPQVCDDEWHHYAVNVNFPVVTLVVDGEEWTDQKDNPEIIDDWPLHPADDITTRITIGACWQGKNGLIAATAFFLMCFLLSYEYNILLGRILNESFKNRPYS